MRDSGLRRTARVGAEQLNLHRMYNCSLRLAPENRGPGVDHRGRISGRGRYGLADFAIACNERRGIAHAMLIYMGGSNECTCEEQEQSELSDGLKDTHHLFYSENPCGAVGPKDLYKRTAGLSRRFFRA